MGYQRAAEEAMRTRVPAGGTGDSVADHEFATPNVEPNAASEAEGKLRRIAELQCRRKLRHVNYWTAVQHALHLGRDVRTYPCPICGGIHVGNASESARTREYRRTRKRLRAIETRMVALGEEWIALVNEKAKLLSQVGEPDVLATMMSEIAGQIGRLAKLVRLWARPGPA